MFELKPIRTDLGQLKIQIEGWGYEIGETRLLFYDRNGFMLEGVVDNPIY